jgi:tetratricopeptide (TPR) repeat protein
MTGEQPFGLAHLSEIQQVEVLDRLAWVPVRRHFGVGAFGVNAYVAADAGDPVVEDHDEVGGGAGRHEELYFVAAGRARFTVGGEELDAPSGTFVFVRDPSARRCAVAEEAGTTVLVVGGARGRAYSVSPWEYYFAAAPYAKAGDYDRAASTVAEGLASYPDHASLLYNLACYESLGGHWDEALGHLARAVELDPRAREWAKDDADLDPIREDPAFPA